MGVPMMLLIRHAGHAPLAILLQCMFVSPGTFVRSLLNPVCRYLRNASCCGPSAFPLTTGITSTTEVHTHMALRLDHNSKQLGHQSSRFDVRGLWVIPYMLVLGAQLPGFCARFTSVRVHGHQVRWSVSHGITRGHMVRGYPECNGGE